MPKPKINLYAEILVHIRQLTLHASLETDKNEHTKILISSDKHIITALHDGESAGIYLPTQISGTANVTFPYDRKTEISVRLQIDDKDVDQLRPPDDSVSGVEVPWSAADLSEPESVVAIECKGCAEVVVDSGTVSVWKDLPSAHWADLMDVWFCHKPHDEHSEHDHAAESKGFSAKSKIVASQGIGLIDTVSFLLNRDDCRGLDVSQWRKCRPFVTFPLAQRKRPFSLILRDVQLIWFLIHSPQNDFSSEQTRFR